MRRSADRQDGPANPAHRSIDPPNRSCDRKIQCTDRMIRSANRCARLIDRRRQKIVRMNRLMNPRRETTRHAPPPNTPPHPRQRGSAEQEHPAPGNDHRRAVLHLRCPKLGGRHNGHGANIRESEASAAGSGIRGGRCGLCRFDAEHPGSSCEVVLRGDVIEAMQASLCRHWDMIHHARIGVIAMTASSLSVTGNSILLRRVRTSHSTGSTA